MSIKLSICIPTYNRGNFIGETIQSIIDQATEEIEIVISDNASQDNTEAIVQSFKEKFPNITYFRWSENMGADKNYLKAVELAKGEYCWLMGSDDTIADDAIKIIFSKIASHSDVDIFLCDRIECDIKMKPLSNRTWFSDAGLLHDTSTHQGMINYFNSANSLGGVFSFLSSIIVRKNRWVEDENMKDFIGTAYIHVYLLMKIITSGCKLKHINIPLIMCRGENDSFATDGACKRILLDYKGYFQIAERFFSTSSETFNAFIKILKREHPFRRLIKIQQICSEDDFLEFSPYLAKVGWNNYQIRLAYHLRRVYSLYKKIKGSSIDYNNY